MKCTDCKKNEAIPMEEIPPEDYRHHFHIHLCEDCFDAFLDRMKKDLEIMNNVR